jgi:hypothetical protein
LQFSDSYFDFLIFQVDYNHDRSSRASTFIGESEKAKYEEEGSVDWEGYVGNESYRGKVRKISCWKRSIDLLEYLWRGVAPKRNVFLGKNVALPNLKYQLKNKTHPWPKTFPKDTVQLSHMSFTTL